MKICKSIDLNIFHLIILFTLSSFLGWTSEVLYAYYIHHHFVNRGFLTGPFCTIYGFGFIIIFIFLNKFKKNIFLFFILSTLLTSALELITGWALDVFFNTRYWNYSSYPFNINGYICLYFSLIWGISSLLIFKLFSRFANFIISLIPYNRLSTICVFILFYFFSDLLMSSQKLTDIKYLFENIFWIAGCFFSNIATPLPNINKKFKLYIHQKLLLNFYKI